VPTLIAGRDLVHLEAEEPSLRELALRLWNEAPDSASRGGRFLVALRTIEDPVLSDPEENLCWELSDDETRLAAPGLSLVVRPSERTAEGAVARDLLTSRPDLVVRLLLETPVTAMKMVRQQLLHAGAVVGRNGAVVIRGSAGAGKSTLVAACWAEGLGVLGDESLLVDRDDPDLLEATLRDLTLTEAATRLLGLEADTVPAFSGGERKRRVPLLGSSAPSDRLARRVATVLLGPCEPGPARLFHLTGQEFLQAFEAGGVPQERRYRGSPETAASAWNGHETYRLDGAVDLPRAVRLIGDLARRTGRPESLYSVSTK
jgi:hypothetical protein